MSRHRMAPADAAWLRMDRPTNLMVVTSVMWFEEPVAPDAIRALLRDRVLGRFPRFTQRVTEGLGLWWEDVEDFDLEDHLHPVDLPGPAGRVELEDFVSGLVSEPLPHDRPLWDLYLVGHYGTGSALVYRIHHAIADGIALVRLLLSLTDDTENPPVEVAPPHEPGSAAGLAARLGHEALELARHPLDLARLAVADGTALAKLVLLPADAHTALRGPAGVPKKVVWSDPIPLDRVKQVGHEAGATVNDVLLAAVSGALRTHLVRRRSPVHDLRAIVPFNLRALDAALPADLGNKFGLVYLSLPVTTARRRERLQEMTRRMQAIKDSAEGVVAYTILELVGMAPAAVERVAIDLFASKGTGVMTNVPGPRHRVTFAGVPLGGSIGWGPTSGELGLGVAIYSYAGAVTIGLCGDVGLVPDVRSLLEDILRELDALLSETPTALVGS